jgi:hypothetical protein
MVPFVARVSQNLSFKLMYFILLVKDEEKLKMTCREIFLLTEEIP